MTHSNDVLCVPAAAPAPCAPLDAIYCELSISVFFLGGRSHCGARVSLELLDSNGLLPHLPGAWDHRCVLHSQLGRVLLEHSHTYSLTCLQLLLCCSSVWQNTSLICDTWTRELHPELSSETRSHSLAQTGFKLGILCLSLPQCWDYGFASYPRLYLTCF